MIQVLIKRKPLSLHQLCLALMIVRCACTESFPPAVEKPETSDAKCAADRQRHRALRHR